MQFQHFFAAGQLVQAVDVLGDDRFQLSGLLQLRQLEVGRVGPGRRENHFFLVEIIKLGGVAAIKRMAQHRFRRILILLVVKSVHTPEIGNPALG